MSQARWKFRTGKSGDSGDGVHGDGDAHAVAPLEPAPPHRAAHWAGLSPVLFPPPVQELLKNLKPDRLGSPLTAACVCGRGLRTDEGGSG